MGTAVAAEARDPHGSSVGVVAVALVARGDPDRDPPQGEAVGKHVHQAQHAAHRRLVGPDGAVGADDHQSEEVLPERGARRGPGDDEGPEQHAERGEDGDDNTGSGLVRAGLGERVEYQRGDEAKNEEGDADQGPIDGKGDRAPLHGGQADDLFQGGGRGADDSQPGMNGDPISRGLAALIAGLLS